MKHQNKVKHEQFCIFIIFKRDLFSFLSSESTESDLKRTRKFSLGTSQIIRRLKHLLWKIPGKPLLPAP